MQKQLHKIFITLFLFCFISSPIVFAYENEINLPKDETEKMELVQNDVRIDDPDIEPINTKDIKNVVPDTKKEGKRVLSLFFKAMFTVLICTLALYFLLLIIKKNWHEAFDNNKTEEEFEALDLSTPNNKTEALKSFLNRTK